MLCFCATFAVAQNLSEFNVVSFEEKPFDTAARDERYKIVDGNGELFSIIKLVSNNADDDLRAYSFDFGLPESRVKQVDGSVWVYVQRNAMRVTIKREGYRPVKYELPVTIQPGQVFEMVLTAEALPVYREILQFNIKPAGVKATVMYKKNTPGAQLQFFGMTDNEGAVAKNLELGTYIYEIHTDNYHKSEGLIELKENKGKHIENVTLRPNFSTVTLEAGEGVDIYVNDELKGTGSWSGVLNAGTYSVECRKEKHKSVSENIVVTDSCDQTITLKSPVPIVGSLMMISTPLGANITVDGEEHGITPLTIENLLIGEHTIIVSKDDFKSDTCIVDITENKMLEKTVALKSITHVTITTKPKVAELYINDEYVGSTPYSAEMLPGEYNLCIVKEGFRNFERRVQFEGTELNVRYKLKRQYKQKYGVYLEAAAQGLNMTGVGLNTGFYSNNFNMEVFGTYCLDKTPIYVNYSDNRESLEEIPQTIHAGGKMGVGIILGRRFRITPQVGAGIMVVQSENILANSITALGAVRFECAIFKNLGISITPEYVYPLKKGEVYEKLLQVSPVLKGCEGFGLRVGLYLY